MNNSTAITHSEAVEHSHRPADTPILDRIQNIASFSQLLRLLGASAVIASMSLFLLNGWSEGNDIQRYLKLLAQTGLLATAGVVLSFVLKENKGARIFFGLSLISVVANFTILGALTYSMIQLDGQLLQYPAMVTWKAVNPAMFWPICIGAMVLLAVISRFSFSIFSRSIAGPLTMHFLLMSSLLMVPVRASLTVSVLAIVSIWLSSMLVKKLGQSDKVVFTPETKFSLALMFLPSFIIIARAVSLYSVDEMLLITLCGMAYFCLRTLLTRFNEVNFLRRIMQVSMYFLGIVIAFQVVELLPFQLRDAGPIVLSAIIASFMLDQIKQSNDNAWNTRVLNATIVILVCGNIFLAFLDASLIWKLSALVIAFASFHLSNYIKENVASRKFSKAVSLIGCALSALLVLLELVELTHLGSWAAIGVIGITFIICASLYERFGLALGNKKAALHE